MQNTRRQQTVSAAASPGHQRWSLFGLALLMLAAAICLGAIGGAPRLPDSAPRLEQVRAVLSGSTLPVQPLALLLLDLAWLLWLWIVASMGLEIAVEGAEALARGAAWARSLRRLTDRVTFPLARRAVAAAFAVQILSRGVPVAGAQPITAAELAILAEVESQASPQAAVAAFDPASEAPDALYGVRAGDTLWSIAEQAYGSGAAYRRLVDANVGRRMPDGRVFSAQGVIRPGWELVVPERTARVEEVDGQRWYTVEAGDTLTSIAAEVLGDDGQWSALFELNLDAHSPDGQRSLTNPDVIWPGLRLRIPLDPAPPVDPVQPAPADLVAASAPAGPASAPSAEASTGSPAIQASVLPPAGIDPLPLMRTLHIVEPIAGDPSTDQESAAEPAEPGDPAVPTDQEAPPSLAQPQRDRALEPAALGGIGLVAIAGVALGARRMRRLRRLPHEPESEVVVEGGFAEAQLAHDFTRGLHGVGFDPVAAIVDHVMRFLDEYNLGQVRIVALRHGRSATTLTLASGLAEQPILLDLAPDCVAPLDAEIEAWVSADQDVVYRLTRVRKTRLLPGVAAEAGTPCLVPVGVLYDRQQYLAAWSSLGHVLIASQPGHGADTILTSLLATLTARRSPQQLRVWMIAPSRALAAPLFDLPHLARVVDPGDEPALARAVDDLADELDRRGAQETQADLLLVVPELTSLGAEMERFDLLASRAARVGVRLIAATSSAQATAQSSILTHFGTRMVLRMQDEEASMAMLGVADAAFLGGGGRLLLRLDGREPVELYGYHIAPEHLERLVRVMRSAYPPEPGSAARLVQPTPPTSPGGQSLVEAATREPEVPQPPSPVRASGRTGESLPSSETVGKHATAAMAPAATVRARADRASLLATPGAPTTTPADNATGAANTETEAQPTSAISTPADGTTRPVTTQIAVSEPAAKAPGAESVTPAVGLDASAEPAPAAAPRACDVAASAGPAVAEAARPAIEVICFGGPRVLCAGQQVWPRRRAGEAKPWELLLYLASQPAEGVSSEDAVGALWPDEEEALDAPHRFRQLRYRLRHQLASVTGAPDNDGICLDRGTLRLDPGLVYSDAHEFLALVRSARITPGIAVLAHLERARELYQGDLLEGPDARRYGWLDERNDSGVTLREHFRHQFERLSTRLADLYAESGKAEAAIELYHDLTGMDPSDERLWRALFRLHANRGDRLALVREEHRLRVCLRALAAELDGADGSQIADPSRETAQEYHRLLAGLQERDRRATAV